MPCHAVTWRELLDWDKPNIRMWTLIVATLQILIWTSQLERFKNIMNLEGHKKLVGLWRASRDSVQSSSQASLSYPSIKLFGDQEARVTNQSLPFLQGKHSFQNASASMESIGFNKQFSPKMHYTARKHTWKLKTVPWKRKNIYKQPWFFGFYVCFRGCTYQNVKYQKCSQM